MRRVELSSLLGFSRAIDAITRFIGYHVRWLVLAAVLVSATNAIIRKAFNSSSNAWLEAQWLLFGAVFMLAAAYVLQVNGHVRIDVISSCLKKRTRDWIDLLGHLFMLAPLTLIMIWLSGPFFMESWRNNEVSSSAGGLAVWPAKFFVLAGFVLLFFQMVSEVIKRIAVLRGLVTEEDQHDTHTEIPAGEEAQP